ncbi:cutinase [Geopyxis carbonaria]|nr:cutinase [Geopyxis carbonaria]
MQFATIILALLTAVASAAPAPTLERRQSANDFTNGGCKSVIMAYARGSTELGNVGTLGPTLESGLDSAFGGDFAMQGVEYPADLASNFLPDGTSKDAIKTMTALLTKMATQCPQARLVAGGYSQGSALAAAALQAVSADVKARVDATVFFGYTKNLQNSGGVPGYPSDKLKIFCNAGDLVCTGSLVITAAHLAYGPKVADAVQFIASKVQV